jgi:hypothetical protein
VEETVSWLGSWTTESRPLHSLFHSCCPVRLLVHLPTSGSIKPGRHRNGSLAQGCHNGRFWIKMTVRKSISFVCPFSSFGWPRPPIFTPRTQLYPRTGLYRVRADTRPLGADTDKNNNNNFFSIRADANLFIFSPVRADAGRVHANASPVCTDAEKKLKNYFYFIFNFFLLRKHTYALMFFFGGWRCEWGFDHWCRVWAEAFPWPNL